VHCRSMPGTTSEKIVSLVAVTLSNCLDGEVLTKCGQASAAAIFYESIQVVNTGFAQESTKYIPIPPCELCELEY
jgi:hypothetical protein